MEQEECIICLEFIYRETGNYRIELCDKCKYIIHIHCWEDYCKYRGNSYCVVCNKLLDDDKVLSNNNLITPSGVGISLRAINPSPFLGSRSIITFALINNYIVIYNP